MPIVGSVAELWRFPVKSMKGEQLQEVTVTEQGVLGDRAYALIDAETGKVVSAKSVKLFPDILACQAAFVAPPRAEGEIPPVRIDLPNGTSVTIHDNFGVGRKRLKVLHPMRFPSFFRSGNRRPHAIAPCARRGFAGRRRVCRRHRKTPDRGDAPAGRSSQPPRAPC